MSCQLFLSVCCCYEWMGLSVSTLHTVLMFVPVSLCICVLSLLLFDGQIQYKDSVGQGTAIPDLPEVKRVRETQKNISLVEEQAAVTLISSPLQSSPNIAASLVLSLGFPSSILTKSHESFLLPDQFDYEFTFS